MISQTLSKRNLILSLTLAVAVFGSSCSQPATTTGGVKKIAANQEYAGFLKDYSKLAPNADLEGAEKVYISEDAEKNLHKYVAVIVDPVQVYLASDADESKLPEKTREAVANYFRAALTRAVSDAFPPVDTPGPLVLRLRAAVIGVDAGGEVAAGDKPSDPNDAIDRSANISKVGVEIELVDSVTGEQIAAVVDREPLGANAQVGAANISRHDKSAAARAAFDEWASRVRTFLNRALELKGKDAERADQSYQPYGPTPQSK
jgi:hypothetical protein